MASAPAEEAAAAGKGGRCGGGNQSRMLVLMLVSGRAFNQMPSSSSSTPPLPPSLPPFPHRPRPPPPPPSPLTVGFDFNGLHRSTDAHPTEAPKQVCGTKAGTDGPPSPLLHVPRVCVCVSVSSQHLSVLTNGGNFSSQYDG